jgi:AmiR/NasT family two-component response regulator
MDVARYLASHTSTGFMFLSAFGDPAIVDETARLGALGYLVKPIDIRQVVPAVNAALAKLDAMPAAAARPAPPPAAVAGRDEAIAIGILMERLRLDQGRALQALREQARNEGVSTESLATRMVEAANRLNSIARGRPPDPTS